MKKDIHPEYYQAKVTCSCGNSFTVGATVPEIKVEICSNCHPFYTGKQKLVDSAGRVDKYKAREEAAKKKAADMAKKKEAELKKRAEQAEKMAKAKEEAAKKKNLAKAAGVKEA